MDRTKCKLDSFFLALIVTTLQVPKYNTTGSKTNFYGCLGGGGAEEQLVGATGAKQDQTLTISGSNKKQIRPVGC